MKIDNSDPNAERTKQIVNRIKEMCGPVSTDKSLINTTTVTIGAAVALSSMYACYHIMGNKK